jgi:hypothetical protein
VTVTTGRLDDVKALSDEMVERGLEVLAHVLERR